MDGSERIMSVSEATDGKGRARGRQGRKAHLDIRVLAFSRDKGSLVMKDNLPELLTNFDVLICCWRPNGRSCSTNRACRPICTVCTRV